MNLSSSVSSISSEFPESTVRFTPLTNSIFICSGFDFHFIPLVKSTSSTRLICSSTLRETEIFAATLSTGTTPDAAKTLFLSITVATSKPSITNDGWIRFSSKFAFSTIFFKVESFLSGSASRLISLGRLTITYTSQSLYGYLKSLFLISSSLALIVIV